MPALDPTVGGANANTYATVATADAYFAGRLWVDAWTAASTPARETALLMATARLDEERYDGERTTLTQRLKWPRKDVLDDDGDDVPMTTLPRELVEATCEVALWFLLKGADPAQPDPLAKFADLTLPGVSLTLRPDAPAPDALPAKVYRLLRPFRTDADSTRLDRLP